MSRPTKGTTNENLKTGDSFTDSLEFIMFYNTTAFLYATCVSGILFCILSSVLSIMIRARNFPNNRLSMYIAKYDIVFGEMLNHVTFIV